MRSKQEELKSLAAEIIAWKSGHHVTLARLIAAHPELGSDKTLTALAKGRTTDLNADKWLTNYRTVAARLREQEAALSVSAGILPLSNIGPASEAVDMTVVRHASGIDRLVVIEGTSGSGKTTNLRKIHCDLQGAVCYMIADPTWRSARVAAGEMLLALGVPAKSIKSSKIDRQKDLIDRLQRRVVLLIDEGHEAGSADFLSLIKTIINKTPAIVVIAAMDTIWRKVRKEFAEEARQLLHNRLSERVILQAPTADDVIAYFEPLGAMPRTMAKEVAELAAYHGHMSFLRRLYEEADLTRKEGETLAEVMADAVSTARRQVGAA